jgi:SAM-dependent methyltransferase
MLGTPFLSDAGPECNPTPTGAMSPSASARARIIRGVAERPEHPVFARIYERMIAGSEQGGLAEMRGALLARAAGRTLEIGAGTGLDLPHYTDAVSELVLAEPDPHMAARLRERVESGSFAPQRITVIEAPAEDLPFDDGSFDTVVSALVLCTVGDLRRSLAEAKRVLVEDGALLFLEHVRSQSRRRAWWQDRIERPWGALMGGCHPNRATAEALADAGLHIEQLDRGRFPKSPPWIRPMISGVARRP